MTLAGPLLLLCEAYSLVVIVHVVTSWVQVDRANPLVRAIDRLVNPVLESIRKAFPFVVQGTLDLSPIVLLVAIQLAAAVIRKLALAGV